MICKKCGLKNEEGIEKCASCGDVLEEKSIVEKYNEFDKNTSTYINKIIYTLFTIITIYFVIDLLFYLLILLVQKVVNPYPTFIDYVKYILIVTIEVYYFYRKRKVKKL